MRSDQIYRLAQASREGVKDQRRLDDAECLSKVSSEYDQGRDAGCTVAMKQATSSGPKAAVGPTLFAFDCVGEKRMRTRTPVDTMTRTRPIMLSIAMLPVLPFAVTTANGGEKPGGSGFDVAIEANYEAMA